MPKSLSLMPGPKIYPIVGSVLEYSRFGRYSFERMHIAKQENMHRYGKIYRERMGRDFVQLFDPADIEVVQRAEGKFPNRPGLPLCVVANKRDGKALGLGSLNGEEWWRVRSSAQQSMMRPDAALPYLPLQNHVADQFLALIRHQLSASGAAAQHANRETTSMSSGDGSVIEDILPLLTRYTTEAFGTVCFRAEIGCLEPDVSANQGSSSKLGSGQGQLSGCPEVAVRLMAATNKMFSAVQQTNFSFPSYALWRTKLYRQFIESSDVCHSIARKYVEKALSNTSYSSHSSRSPTASKEETAAGKSDVGSLDGGMEAWEKCPNFLERLLAENSGRISVDNIIQLAVDLFTAGIDSTANAISFCLYNLARNPDKQSRLIEELNHVLPGSAPVTAESLQKLRYLHACVKESFRINFPVEGGAVREIEKDLILSDYLVPKGTLVALNYQTICLQEEYFPRPREFIPERWLRSDRSHSAQSTSGQTGSVDTEPDQAGSLNNNENMTSSRQAPTFSLLPFGYGSRMCIGRRFALQETYLAIIKILQHYELECVSGSEEVGMINRVFTMPDRPVSLIFKPRR